MRTSSSAQYVKRHTGQRAKENSAMIAPESFIKTSRENCSKETARIANIILKAAAQNGIVSSKGDSMTIKELIEKAALCDLLEVTIRENGEGKWVYQYKIGEEASCSKYDELYIDGEWKTAPKCFAPNQPLEFRHPCGGGHSLPGRIIPKDPKKAPKEVMELEICDFQAMTVFSKRNYWGIFATAYPKGWTKPIQEEKPTEQMTLF